MGDRLINQPPRASDTNAQWIDKTELETLLQGLDRGGGGHMATGVLLADVTSLMLLSAAADKFCVSGLSSDDNSGLITATNSAVDLLMKTLLGHSSGKASTTSSDETLLPSSYGSRQSPEPHTADTSNLDHDQNSVEHFHDPRESVESMDNISLSKYQSDEEEVFQSCESRPETPESINSSRRLSSTMSGFGETASILTQDSGLASPAPTMSTVFHSPILSDSDLKDRVQVMKTCVDRKLALTLMDVTPTQRTEQSGRTVSEIVGIENPLMAHLEILRRRHMENISGAEDTGPLHELLVERALASSFLIIENAKLSKEVGHLKSEVQQLKVQMQEEKDKISLNTIECEVQTSPGLDISDDDDEMDIGGSDLLYSSDSVYLLPPSLLQLRHSEMSLAVPSTQRTVVTSPPRITPRKKLEVPSPLRAANYLSIASDDEIDSDIGSEMKISPFFCCGRMFGCC